MQQRSILIIGAGPEAIREIGFENIRYGHRLTFQEAVPTEPYPSQPTVRILLKKMKDHPSLGRMYDAILVVSWVGMRREVVTPLIAHHVELLELITRELPGMPVIFFCDHSMLRPQCNLVSSLENRCKITKCFGKNNTWRDVFSEINQLGYLSEH